MDENEKRAIFYRKKIHDHLELADYSIGQAIDALADKGNAEFSNAACLIAIAECLMAIGTWTLIKEEGEKDDGTLAADDGAGYQ